MQMFRRSAGVLLAMFTRRNLGVARAVDKMPESPPQIVWYLHRRFPHISGSPHVLSTGKRTPAARRVVYCVNNTTNIGCNFPMLSHLSQLSSPCVFRCGEERRNPCWRWLVYRISFPSHHAPPFFGNASGPELPPRWLLRLGSRVPGPGHCKDDRRLVLEQLAWVGLKISV